jgi:dinuclear metal center YbgI/SA1388 family protein
MKIADITRHLESLSPLALQEDYDNCGLLIGDPVQEVQRVLVCLDLTEAVMDEAIARNCNLVISHHPFIFRGLKKLTSGQPETLILTRAVKHDIAVYAIHTNLDNTLHGLNAFVLRRIGVSHYGILRPKPGMLLKLAVFCPEAHAEKVRRALFEAGAGHIGNYDSCSFNLDGHGTFRGSDASDPFVGSRNERHTEPETRVEVILPRYLVQKAVAAMLAAHPYEEVAYDLYALENKMPGAGAGLVGLLDEPCSEADFLDRMKVQLDLPVIRHTQFPGRTVRTVALCTGSGSFLIQDAIMANADVYVTADLKYHDFFGMENRLLLADIGHFESEKWVKEWLHAVLIEKFPNFAVLISEVNTNPVHYY